MTVLFAANLQKSFGHRTVLKEVTFELASGDCLGIVGPNGSGKTTLLKLLAGLDAPETGTVTWRQGIRTGYLPQGLDASSCDVWTFFRDRLPAMDEGALLAIASQFGFTQAELSRPLGSLSGGEKTRASLVAVAGHSPDVFLLDEPTNHLDIDGIEWLQTFLSQSLRSRKTLILVSHDRDLLDKLCNRTLLLEEGTARLFPGNYSSCIKQIENERLQQQREYESAARKIDQLKEALSQKERTAGGIEREPRRGRDFYGRKAKKLRAGAKAMERRIDRLERSRPAKPNDPDDVRIVIGDSQSRKNRILWLSGVEKRYGDHVLFSQAGFEVRRGERVGLVGANGCGKSTLLRICMGTECPDKGEVYLSGGVHVAYFDQEQINLNEQRRILDELKKGTDEDETLIRTLLARMHLKGDRVYQIIRTLSYGERIRVALAKIILGRPDILFLDEPTNHLDMESREAVEDALRLYRGSAVFASHDRRFLRLAGKVLAFHGGTLQLFTGGYDEYADWVVRASSTSATGSTGENPRQESRSSAVDADERLLLETRLAEIGSRLSASNLTADEKQALEFEYLATAKKLQRVGK